MNHGTTYYHVKPPLIIHNSHPWILWYLFKNIKKKLCSRKIEIPLWSWDMAPRIPGTSRGGFTVENHLYGNCPLPSIAMFDDKEGKPKIWEGMLYDACMTMISMLCSKSHGAIRYHRGNYHHLVRSLWQREKKNGHRNHGQIVAGWASISPSKKQRTKKYRACRKIQWISL